LIPAYSSLTIYYDVECFFCAQGEGDAFERVKGYLEAELQQLAPPTFSNDRLIQIPVCYGGDYGPDLQTIAAVKGLPVEEIIHIHTASIYRVYMIGFLPGFPYMGKIDERIAVPRLENPRVKVACGSVGIAGFQTGIYPLESPGGWQLIGRTPIALFNKHNHHPVLLVPGDQVQFYPISHHEFERYQSRTI
jgi:inhibitor of KinA